MNDKQTLQAIDYLLEDFGIKDITEHIRDVFKNHLRNSEGYDHDALADEYEIGTRILDILAQRILFRMLGEKII